MNSRPKNRHWELVRRKVAFDDGLATRESGPWTFDKLYWWSGYVEITTKAMVGSPAWPGVVYVDLFAGPGICTTRSSQERYPGSALIAACAPKPFDRMIFCEEDEDCARACEQRLRVHGAGDRSHVLIGDCNQRVADVARLIPPRSLTIAFVDPTGLHADFETLRVLTTGRAVDLVILFADHMDIVRNISIYTDQANSKLDRILGPDIDWRGGVKDIANHTPQNIAKFFATLLKSQLKKLLGYEHIDEAVLRNSRDTPIYRLIYASKHPRGLDFWKKATLSSRSGRRLFD